MAKTKEPHNKQLDVLCSGGGFNAIFYRYDMPDCLVAFLVEELNVTNGLGLNNTLMQKIRQVPYYFERWNEFNAENNNAGSGTTQFLAQQWTFVKGVTELYESDIAWKKAQALYNTLSSTHVFSEDDTTQAKSGPTLLDKFGEYFEAHADVMKLQSIEKQRNLLKYLADLSTKFLPQRKLPGKGQSERYPALFLVALKLSICSDDQIPCVLLSETALNKLSDTSVSLALAIGDSLPSRKRREARKSTAGNPGEASSDKNPLNQLDIVARALIRCCDELRECHAQKNGEVFEMARQKLLEFVFRAQPMEVTVGESTKTLKTLCQAVEHFSAAIIDSHAVDRRFLLKEKVTSSKVSKVGSAGSLEGAEDTTNQISCVVALPIILLRSIADGSMTWIVRPRVGHNMKKRIEVGSTVILQSNTNRLEVTVEELVVTSQTKDLEEQLNNRNVAPSDVGHGAATMAEAIAWLEATLSITPSMEVVAFKVKINKTDTGNADGIAADALDIGRRLKPHLSEELDPNDQGVRSKYKELLLATKKHGIDVLQWESFPKLVTKAIRAGQLLGLTEFVAHVVNSVIGLLPRGVDTLVALEGSGKQPLNVPGLRKIIIVKFIFSGAPSSWVPQLRTLMENLDAMLQTHDFPNQPLDVDGFASDLVVNTLVEDNAQRDLEKKAAMDAQENAMQKALQARDEEIVALKQQLSAIGTSAASDVILEEALKDENLIIATEVQLGEAGVVGSGRTDALALVPIGGAETKEAMNPILRKLPALLHSNSKCVQFEINEQWSGGCDIHLRSALLQVGLEMLYFQAAVRAKEVLEELSDNQYKAKEDIPAGSLALVYTGRIVSDTLSLFKMPLGAFNIDGTQRARDAWSPWRVRRASSGEAYNMVLEQRALPRIVILGDQPFGIEQVSAPALVNKSDIHAGDALIMQPQEAPSPNHPEKKARRSEPNTGVG